MNRVRKLSFLKHILMKLTGSCLLVSGGVQQSFHMSCKRMLLSFDRFKNALPFLLQGPARVVHGTAKALGARQ